MDPTMSATKLTKPSGLILTNKTAGKQCALMDLNQYLIGNRPTVLAVRRKAHSDNKQYTLRGLNSRSTLIGRVSYPLDERCIQTKRWDQKIRYFIRATQIGRRSTS